MLTAEDQLNEAQLTYLRVLIDNGCKFKWRIELFGKTYVWLTDRTGTWFLERIPDNIA